MTVCWDQIRTIITKLSNKQEENIRLIQKMLIVGGNNNVPMMFVAKQVVQLSLLLPATSRLFSLASSAHKYKFVGANFNQKLKVNKECTTDLQKIAKGFLLVNST